MRTLFSTRKRLNDPVLKRLITYYYITTNVQTDKEYLLSFIDTSAVSSSTSQASTSNIAPMETDDQVIKNEPSSQSSTVSCTPVPSTTQSTGQTTTTTTTTTTTAPKVKLPSITLPEVDLYIHLLVLLFAIDKKKLKQVFFNFY